MVGHSVYYQPYASSKGNFLYIIMTFSSQFKYSLSRMQEFQGDIIDKHNKMTIQNQVQNKYLTYEILAYYEIMLLLN